MKEKEFKQTPENLLYEAEQVQYQIVQKENKIPAPKDTRIAADLYMKNRIILMTAKILREIRLGTIENIPIILIEESEKGTTLFRCDVHDNLDRIMPPP